MKKFMRALTVTAALLSVVTAVTVAAADTVAAVADQTLHYDVKYGNRNAGTVTVTVTGDADGYTVTSSSKPSVLASLFVKSHRSQTRFVYDGDGGGVTVAGGVEKFDDGHEHSFNHDRDRRRITFADGDTVSIKDGDRLEAAAFPLLLMLRPLDDIAGVTVREVSFKRVRDYVYEAPVNDAVTVAAGEFETTRVRRHRADRPADTVTVHLARADRVPVKIVIVKKNKTTTLSLIHVAD